MRKTWISVVLIVTFLFMAMPLSAGEWVKLEPGQVIVEQTYIDELIATKDELIADVVDLQVELTALYEDLDDRHLEILGLEAQIETAIEALIKKNTEIAAIEAELTLCLERPQVSEDNVWIGASTGYPFGLLGTIGYQFSERYMVNGGIGYMGGFQFQVGFSRKM